MSGDPTPGLVLTMARIAGGAAHDLRNVVLLPLALTLERTERALSDGDIERARALLAELGELARHGEAAVERLDQLARQHGESAVRLGPVDLSALATRAAGIARAHAVRRATDGQRTTRIIVAPAPAVTATIDAYEVTSAVVNLVVNAIDALGDGGGTVTISVGSEPAPWIEVADDGPGIADDVRTHMFEPFYSTKGDHRAGLGLGMVASCMHRHGGTVAVDSRPGDGARFRLTFPR